jgi:hypothetical protein
MTVKEIYSLVYDIVRRAQKENTNLKISNEIYEWSKRIPKPSQVTDELAEAICISISSSGPHYGLELLYQEKVFFKDLKSASLEDKIPHLLVEKNTDGNRFSTLGDLIREVFKHRALTPNHKEKELLQKI